MRKKYFDKKTEQAIIDDYQNRNMKLKDICKKYDITSGGIIAVLNKYQIQPTRNITNSSKKRMDALNAHNESIRHTTPDSVICNDYLSGKPVKVIAAECGVSANTIYIVLRKHGITKYNKRSGERYIMDDDTKKQIVDEYNNGKTLTDICNKYLITTARVYNVLVTAGYNLQRKLPSRYKNIVPKNDADKIVNDYKNGKSFNYIEKHYGVRYNEVLRILAVNDVSVRDNTMIQPAEYKRRKTIADAYNNGMTISEIKEIFNTTETSIYKYVDEFNVPRKRKA